MKKIQRLFVIFLLSLLAGVAGAQVTAVSGTVTDSDGISWFNATVTATFVPNPNYPQANQYNINGVSLTSSTYSSYLQSSVVTGSGASAGQFTINLLDNSKIAPGGSSWKIVIQSYTSAPSSTFPNLAVQGASQSITGFLTTNITSPRFPAGSSITGAAYGYSTLEVSPTPVPGGSFFNTATQLTNVWSGYTWNQQAIGNFCSLVGCTLSGEIQGPLAIFQQIYSNISINNAFVPNNTIAEAISAAGTTGSVYIEANYLGTDTFSANPSGVYIQDARPMSNAYTPIIKVNAAQYGALCKGIASGIDDTAAIQSAFNANYAYNQQIANKSQVVIELPQGSCVVTAPIQMGIYGSMVGQGNPTVLACNYAAWHGTDYNCVEYLYNGALPGITPVANRRIENLTIGGYGNSTIPNSRAISIVNSANQYNPNIYAFTNLLFHNMTITGFDTAFYAEDLANTILDAVTIVNSRIGVYLNGDTQAITITHSSIVDGSWAWTSTHNPTVGILTTPNGKYPVGQATGPQGLTVDDGTFVGGFNYDIDQQQCIRCVYTNSTFDEGGAQPIGCVSSCILGGSFLIGQNGTSGGLWITNNFIGNVTGVSNGILINSQANAPGSQSTVGLWIDKNYFLVDSGTDTTTVGVAMNGTATGTMYGAQITNNTFVNMGNGVILNQGYENGTISGNRGYGITAALIALDGTGGTLGQNNTFVDNNIDTDNIPAVLIGSATGFKLGFNQSGTQWTGTQVVSAAGCGITAGAIGNTCNTTIVFASSGGFPLFNTSYRYACTASQGVGLWTLGNGTPSTTQLVIPSIALSNTATAGGFVSCTITSVQ
jgi:hypothetical protein